MCNTSVVLKYRQIDVLKNVPAALNCVMMINYRQARRMRVKIDF